MSRRYMVVITETTTRVATVYVDVADGEDNYKAEEIARQQIAAGQIPPFCDPEVTTRFTGGVSSNKG